MSKTTTERSQLVNADALRRAIAERLRHAEAPSALYDVQIGPIEFADGSWRVIVGPGRPDASALDQAKLLSEIEEEFLTDFGVNIMFVPTKHAGA